MCEARHLCLQRAHTIDYCFRHGQGLEDSLKQMHSETSNLKMRIFLTIILIFLNNLKKILSCLNPLTYSIVVTFGKGKKMFDAFFQNHNNQFYSFLFTGKQ